MVFSAANIQQRPDCFWSATSPVFKSIEKWGALSAIECQLKLAALTPFLVTAFRGQRILFVDHNLRGNN